MIFLIYTSDPRGIWPIMHSTRGPKIPAVNELATRNYKIRSKLHSNKNRLISRMSSITTAPINPSRRRPRDALE